MKHDRNLETNLAGKEPQQVHALTSFFPNVVFDLKFLKRALLQCLQGLQISGIWSAIGGQWRQFDRRARPSYGWLFLLTVPQSRFEVDYASREQCRENSGRAGLQPGTIDLKSQRMLASANSSTGSY